MLRFRTLASAAALCIGVLVAAPTSVSAADDTAVGTQILNLLCNAKGGAPVFTPMTLGRCQEARSGAGFAIERAFCESFLGGDFETVPSQGRAKRVNWFCFRGLLTQ